MQNTNCNTSRHRTTLKNSVKSGSVSASISAKVITLRHSIDFCSFSCACLQPKQFPRLRKVQHQQHTLNVVVHFIDKQFLFTSCNQLNIISLRKRVMSEYAHHVHIHIQDSISFSRPSSKSLRDSMSLSVFSTMGSKKVYGTIIIT